MKAKSRKEKEALYITKEARLQRHWRNPIDDNDWDYVALMTDEELDKSIERVSGQVGFEWMYGAITTALAVVFGLFIVWLLS